MLPILNTDQRSRSFLHRSRLLPSSSNHANCSIAQSSGSSSQLFFNPFPPVGTYGEANATVAQFENKTWFVNLGSPASICTLAFNDYPKKRTGFILMMVATALWCLVGIGLFYALCYYCFKRCPCRIRIERVEKVVPLPSSADDL